jgi:hypothetical protein
MAEQDNDLGVIALLMERFNSRRLPRALSLKEKVDRGELLDTGDIAFLTRVFADANHVKRLADKHPEYQELCAKVAHLYHHITARALENEQNV